MDNLQMIFLFLAYFYVKSTSAANAANLSDSLAVETTVGTISVVSNLAPELKSKTEKRDSSGQIGSLIYSFKEEEPFRAITSATNHQQFQQQSQQFNASPSLSTFQPTTARYVSAEASPQIYYEHSPNVGRDVSAPVLSTSNEKFRGYFASGNNYGTPSHAYRGPFKEPFELRLEQTHPQPHQQSHAQHHQQNQYTEGLKTPSLNLNYVSSPSNSAFIPLEGPLHQKPPYYRQHHNEPNTQSSQPNDQQKEFPQYTKRLQQQPQYAVLQKQPPTHSQLQQQENQQPTRQQTQYIVAIPLSYVRQLQHQLATQYESTSRSQHQQQSSPPIPLQTSHNNFPPLIVLRPISGDGGSKSDSSFIRDPYRLQSPTRYTPQPPSPSSNEIRSHATAIVTPQQLPFPLNLFVTSSAGRLRPPIHSAPQILYVQPQIVRKVPHQQLPLQIKMHQNPAHYVQGSDLHQPGVGGRDAQQTQQQTEPQQYENQRTIPNATKSTVKQMLPIPPSAAAPPSPPQISISSKAPSPQKVSALPLQSSLPSASPPVFFYNPNFVQQIQPPPLEQHPMSPPYENYVQPQLRSGQNSISLIKVPLSNAFVAPQTALMPHIYPLQFQQPSPQQSSSLPTFFSGPGVYMATQDAINSIGVSEKRTQLPYFIHPAGVHYGTHLYNPGTPLALSPKFLQSVATADSYSRQQYQLQHQKQPQKKESQQLDSTSPSASNDNNNSIVKYP